MMRGLDSAIARRRNRDVGLLRELPGADFVAEEAQYTSTWSYEYDAEPFTEVGKPVFLGLETPTGPDRRDLCSQQRLFNTFTILVAAFRLPIAPIDEGCRADRDGIVGLAHKHCLAVRLGE